MKTVLVLAKQSGLPAAIRAVLDADRFRVIGHEELWEAEALLASGTVDVCVLDADLTDVQPIRVIKQVRRLRPECPVLVFAAQKQWEWEEDAYMLGVAHVLGKPVRGRLLNALLERLGQEQRCSPGLFVPAVAPAPPAVDQPRPPVRALEVLRDFSEILSHSLRAEGLLNQFLLLLREILGVNRAAIFLRKPPKWVGRGPSQTENRRLWAACALGLSPNLLEHFELSLASGLGRYVYRSGRILKNGSDEARSDVEIQKEFELLGAQVAIPILDRESLVGVAVFDGRLTGEFFANEELALIFHLLEGLGLAIKNSWLHDQLSGQHEMMAEILNQLSSACLLVDAELNVLHANDAARAFFQSGSSKKGDFEFSDLPQSLASRVFAALKSGSIPAPFKYAPPENPEITYRVSITPFGRRNSVTANAVLLLVEDCTQAERSQRLEIETANLRLLRAMADHLAHEIGNCLVPISTFQQLPIANGADPEVRGTVGAAADEALQRISRLTTHMFFLAQESVLRRDRVLLIDLIRSAFEQAKKHLPLNRSPLHFGEENLTAVIRGDTAGLRHALSEVLLNALHACERDEPVQVSFLAEAHGTGQRVSLEIRDPGSGFSHESAARAVEPFFSTRCVGLGLGLTVARRILELHHGSIEIPKPVAGKGGVVRISLPLAESAESSNGTEKDWQSKDQSR